MNKHDYFRLIPKEILCSKEFRECYGTIDKCENSYISAVVSMFSGKLASFSDEIRHAAITVWNRNNFVNVYDSINFTTRKVFDSLDKNPFSSERDLIQIKFGIAVCSCVFAFTFIKSSGSFPRKLQFRISDICRDVLCDYCDSPDYAFDLVCLIIDNLKGIIREDDTMRSIFAGLTRVIPEIKDCSSDDGVSLCKEVGSTLRRFFEQHY